MTTVEIGDLMTDCLTEQDWPRLMAGEMSAAEWTHAATHLVSCAACADEYRAAHGLRPWAEEAARVLSSESSRPAHDRLLRPWRHRGVLALAASISIAIAQSIALVWLLSDRRGEIARLETEITSHGQELAAARSTLAGLQAQRRAELQKGGDEVAALRETVRPR